MDIVQKKQFTSFLPNAVLNRLTRMRLNPRTNFTSKHRGEHLSGRGGSSTEFSDYRDYSPGDDTRFIDWNIFSRLRRPYLKLYHVEEEKHVVILVDASESMKFENKLRMARQLATAFGVMGLHGNERVSVYELNDANKKIPRHLAPCQGRVNMKKLFSFVESIEAGGVIPLEKGIENTLHYHKGKGVVIILSDFMTFGELRRSFNALFSSGLEIFAIQVLAPAEIDPEINGDLRLFDCETESTLNVSSAGDLLSIYHEHRQRFEENLSKLCQQRSGRFITVNSETPIDQVLFNTLLRRGWIK